VYISVPVGYVPAGYYDDDDDPIVSFTFTEPDYTSALSEGVSINSIFQVLCMPLWPQ